MFKPNPKRQVELKFIELFGKDSKLEVHGTRLSAVEARSAGHKCTTRDGVYLTELFADGHLVAKATSRDWRKSYKMLKLEVEKLYADGLALV